MVVTPLNQVIPPSSSFLGGGGTGVGGGGLENSGLIFGSLGNPPSHNYGRGRYDYRQRKIDIPFFDGSDPDGWILQAERYFAIYQLIDEEKVEVAVLSLSGEALAWFRWSDKQRPIITWNELKGIFLKKFRPLAGEDLFEQFSALEQTGTTTDYVRKFVELAAPLEGVSEQVALGSFIKGLRPVIKNELRLWAPNELGRTMELAQQIEKKNRAIWANRFGSLGYRTSTQLKNPNTTNTPSSSPFTSASKGDGYFRRNSGEDRPLTESQIQEKRAKGLCYKCDDKWSRGHQCKKQVNVILVYEEEAAEAEDKLIERVTHLEMAELIEPVEVSLHSIAGLTSPKTMKLRGTILEQPVVALVDPGATHNFISVELVAALSIPVQDTTPYGVQMGTGDSEEVKGVCKGVQLQLNEIDIMEEFLPLRLGSSDVILGMKWLETLGTTQTNRKEQTMDFEVDR
ncbi:hypothetical protein LXL04_021518 [Taraxacum kok-saghyz]